MKRASTCWRSPAPLLQDVSQKSNGACGWALTWGLEAGLFSACSHWPQTSVLAGHSGGLACHVHSRDAQMFIVLSVSSDEPSRDPTI